MTTECQFAYISFGGEMMGRGKTVLPGCNLLPSLSDRENGTPKLIVDFAKPDMFPDLNRLYMNDEIQGYA